MKTSEFKQDLNSRLNIHVTWLAAIEKDIDRHEQNLETLLATNEKWHRTLNNNFEKTQMLFEFITGKSIGQLLKEARNTKPKTKLKKKRKAKLN